MNVTAVGVFERRQPASVGEGGSEEARWGGVDQLLRRFA